MNKVDIEIKYGYYTDKEFEDKKKNFKNFKNYEKFFSHSGIIINQSLRKEFIIKHFEKISQKKNA